MTAQAAGERNYPHLVAVIGDRPADFALYWLDPRTGVETCLDSVHEVDQSRRARITFVDVETRNREPAAT